MRYLTLNKSYEWYWDCTPEGIIEKRHQYPSDKRSEELGIPRLIEIDEKDTIKAYVFKFNKHGISSKTERVLVPYELLFTNKDDILKYCVKEENIPQYGMFHITRFRYLDEGRTGYYFKSEDDFDTVMPHGYVVSLDPSGVSAVSGYISHLENKLETLGNKIEFFKSLKKQLL